MRALAAAFPKEADQNALTVRERRLANSTPVQFLERAAQLAEAAPAVGATVETGVALLELDRARRLLHLQRGLD